MDDFNDASPLCCCEYIDNRGERNHILAACCSCVELDDCCERLVSCRKVNRRHLRAVMDTCFDRLRCPMRGGAWPLVALCSMITPFLSLPAIAFMSVSCFENIVFITSLLSAGQFFLSSYMARKKSKSLVLYYWTLSFIVCTLIVIVNPMMEILLEEYVLLIAGTIVAMGFFHFSTFQLSQLLQKNKSTEALIEKGDADSICAVCRAHATPRSVHCSICQHCIPRYEFHCFWLDCCICEVNLLPFLLGLILAILALLYAGQLVLTSICRPQFMGGVLVPVDCSEATMNIEIGLVYFFGLYCWNQAVLLILQLAQLVWVISNGITAEEWRLQGYKPCVMNPLSRGCIRNWIGLICGQQKP